MGSIKQRLEKVAYDYGRGTMQTTRPVYEMSDEELKRRLAYERGEAGMRTGLGALSGALVGGAQGAMAGPVGMGVGAVTGGLLGAGLGYGSQKLKEVEARREAARRGMKMASAAEYSVLFDKIADGDLGEPIRQALYGVCETIEAPSLSEKTASVYDVTELSETDARRARLDQLLRR